MNTNFQSKVIEKYKKWFEQFKIKLDIKNVVRILS
jgi:hypothetical protein